MLSGNSYFNKLELMLFMFDIEKSDIDTQMKMYLRVKIRMIQFYFNTVVILKFLQVAFKYSHYIQEYIMSLRYFLTEYIFV